MFRFVGNEKAWAGFLMSFVMALMAKFGLGEAPDPQTLVDQAQAVLGPLITGGLTYLAAWLTTNTAKGGGS